MPAAETARLVAELTLKDKLTPGVKSATKSLGTLDTSLGKIGASAKRGAGVAGKALAGLGVVAAVGLGVAVKGGLESLAELESAVTSVDGAIAQMGLTGKVTGSQVAAWANEIEAATGAAFDDKAIVQATSTLIRFGKVADTNLRPAMEIITDLATKTGDVESAATLLAKALADPEKAAGKLARSGVILTKVEQDQIKAFMKAGDAASAQKVILDSLAATTRGAALASQGPYKRAMSVLADVTEDAQRALAEGFLPVLQRVAKWLSTSLADPKVMADIRSLGRSLADAFDKGVSFVQKIPWGTVRDAMSVVGSAAKMALDAFTSMPAWVQTAVLTGWGVNKLTGGALGDIVGELGKGLIKGVLGINAAVVNLKAASVVGGGPGGVVPTGGKGGAVGKIGGVVGTIGKVFLVGMAAGVAVELAGALGEQSTEIQQQGADLVTNTKTNAPKMTEKEIVAALAAVRAPMKDPLKAAALLLTNPLNKGFDNLLASEKTLMGQLAVIRANTATTSANTGSGAERAAAQTAKLEGVRAAAVASAQAIRAKKWDVDVKVNVPVTVRATLSVRNQAIAVRTNAAYQKSGKVAGIGF